MEIKSKKEKHATVLGASMAGLLTARVLSSHFDRVTLLERDAVHNSPESRKGQPQTRHLHALLASGLQVITRYFPDLPEALIAGGASVMDASETMRWYTYGGYRQPFRMGKEAAMMTRPFLEALIRERVLACPNITLIHEADVQGILFSADGTRVTGIEIERRGNQNRQDQLAADLVVDCTGRGSRSPQWLVAHGFPAPVESEVKVDVGYATRVYRRDPADPRSKQWFICTPEAPAETRFGGAFPVEGNRWIVSVGGWGGDHAPTDPDRFLEYVRKLPAQDIYQIVSQAEPLSDVIPHKFPASLRRHYEKLASFPEGYLTLGDAICSFNPTYGQGMSSAALQVAELDALLNRRGGQSEGIAPEFFKRAAKIIDVPWQMAVGEDFRFPFTTGPKPQGADLINRYTSLVHRATLVDAEVCRTFLTVMNLLAPPPALMTPQMLWRVFKANRRRPAPRRSLAPQA